MLLSNFALSSTPSWNLLDAAHGSALSSLATIMQTQVAVSHLNETLLMWFVGIAAFALIMQAAILLGAAIAGMKIAKDLMKIVEDTRAKAMPLVETTHTLVKDLTPQIKQITNKVEVIVGHVETISGVAVEKVHEFSPTVSAARQTVEQANQTVRDANNKTHQQVVRVNGMITAALDSTERAAAAIQRGIGMPGREVAGIVTGVKAALESFLGKSKHFGADRPQGRSSYQATGSPYRAPITPYKSMADETLSGATESETRKFDL